jgi:hypothetical protein
MLSGSIAMGIYVIPRATKDIDFVVHLRPNDITSFVKHFEGAYYCSEDAINDAVSRQSMFNVIDHASGYKADFVVLKNEEYRLTEFERRQKGNFLDIEVWVVSPEDLLISKLIWIQDWQAAIQVEDIRIMATLPDLDFEYLNYWVKRLNLVTFGILK